MIELFKKRDYFGIAVFTIALGMLVWFFMAKLTLFNKLAYQSDLFSHIQISRSWLEGRTTMFENNYGDHAKYHNYFFNLLMGPLVYWWGGFGIFITQFTLYVLALLYSFPIIYKKVSQKWVVVVFYISVFCGAYAFWLYDDTWFGFHIEMLYIPLGIIFSLSLYKKQHWLSILSGILIVSVKEDGAVLLACLHILYLTWLWSSHQITQKNWLKKTTVWGSVYVVVFILGVIYLKYKNNFAETRLDKAFAQLAETKDEVSINYFITIFKNFGLLLLPLVAWLVYIKVKPKLLFWWFLLLLPITVVNLVSGLVYLPHNTFSLTWIPRFSLTFSLFLAISCYTMLQGNKEWFKTKKLNIVFALIVLVGLFIVQIGLLKAATKYTYSDNAIGIFSKPHPENEKPYYTDIRKVAEILPHNYPVAPPYRLFRYFHKHDFIWISSAYNAWQQPRMVITDETLWEGVNPTERLQNPDSVITAKVNYYFEKEDRRYLVEAGIVEE
jgi:hypothetical protein